jgi:hypothetical protein
LVGEPQLFQSVSQQFDGVHKETLDIIEGEVQAPLGFLEACNYIPRSDISDEDHGAVIMSDLTFGIAEFPKRATMLTISPFASNQNSICSCVHLNFQ